MTIVRDERQHHCEMMFEPSLNNGQEKHAIKKKKGRKNKVRVGEGWKCKQGKNIPGTENRTFKGL